jgi:hypothetical protein
MQYFGLICGEQSGTGEGFTLRNLVFPCDHQNTSGPFTSITALEVFNRPEQPAYYHTLSPQLGIQH